MLYNVISPRPQHVEPSTSSSTSSGWPTASLNLACRFPKNQNTCNQWLGKWFLVSINFRYPKLMVHFRIKWKSLGPQVVRPFFDSCITELLVLECTIWENAGSLVPSISQCIFESNPSLRRRKFTFKSWNMIPKIELSSVRRSEFWRITSSNITRYLCHISWM